MSLITYVPASGYSTSEMGVINLGNGSSFDVGAALTAGAGMITVDNVAQPTLYTALNNFPGLKISGTSGTTPSVADVLAPLEVHVNSGQAGYTLSKNPDGTGSWVVSSGGTSNVNVDVTDVPQLLGNANPGLGLNGASASDHVHAMPALSQLSDTLMTTVPNGSAPIFDGTAGKWRPGAVISNAPLWLGASNGETTLPRSHVDDSGSYSNTPASGVLHITYFTASTSRTIGHIAFNTGGTASAGNTKTLVGLYSVNASTGVLTLVASSANMSGLASYAQVSAAMTATYTLTAGATYAVGILQVGTTSASLIGAYAQGEYLNKTPYIARQVPTQTTLPATISSTQSVGFIIDYFITA
jgi:hypothetical protein